MMFLPSTVINFVHTFNGYQCFLCFRLPTLVLDFNGYLRCSYFQRLSMLFLLSTANYAVLVSNIMRASFFVARQWRALYSSSRNLKMRYLFGIDVLQMVQVCIMCPNRPDYFVTYAANNHLLACSLSRRGGGHNIRNGHSSRIPRLRGIHLAMSARADTHTFKAKNACGHCNVNRSHRRQGHPHMCSFCFARTAPPWHVVHTPCRTRCYANRMSHAIPRRLTTLSACKFYERSNFVLQLIHP